MAYYWRRLRTKNRSFTATFYHALQGTMPHGSGAACCRCHPRPKNGTPYIIGTERMGPRHVIHFHQTCANQYAVVLARSNITVSLVFFFYARLSLIMEGSVKERIDFILTIFALGTLLELILRTYLSCRSDSDGDDHQFYKFVACQTCKKAPSKSLA